jgi:hypothetical protein
MNESNIRQNAGKRGDEIDIFEFCSRLWSSLKSFLAEIRDILTTVIIFITRKSLWILSFAATGAVAGYTMHNVGASFVSSLEADTGSIYDPEMKRYMFGVDNSVVINHINKLESLIDKPATVAKYLGISAEQARTIRSIKAFYGVDMDGDMKPDFVDTNNLFNPRDTVQRKVASFLSVRVSVYDETTLPTLRKALLHYINSNAYIQELFAIDRRQKKDMLASVEKEIAKMDDLQRACILREEKADRAQLFIANADPKSRPLYLDMLSLCAKKQALEQSLEISDEVITVIQDFLPLQLEEKPLSKYAAQFGGLMAAAGLLCSLLWQYRKQILALVRENATK